MSGLPEFDRHPEGGHREHAAPLYPRSGRGPRRLTARTRSQPPILALDAAGSACSAAIGQGGIVLAHERREMRHGHAEALLPTVDVAMRRAGVPPSALGGVAVSTGPGSFTGIRVGLAAAQGIAVAVPAPLIGVTSFAAVAALVPELEPGGLLLVALDSRRSELFVQLFAADGMPVAEPAALLPLELADYLAARVGTAPLRVAGDAAAAAAAALPSRLKLKVIADSAPDARGVLAVVGRRGEDATVPAHPLYLRPPDVTAPAATRPAPGDPSALRITPLPLSAAAPLALLHRACFPDEPWDAVAMARILSLSGCFGQLAWIDETPVGFVLARDLGDETEVLSLGVAPAMRRRGIGARLLRSVLDEARRRGTASIVLEVATDNRAARRLYNSLGFVRVGHRPRYYRRPGGVADASILRLSLSDTTKSRQIRDGEF